MKNSNQLVVDAKLSVQRALLGRVTSNLRAVVFTIAVKDVQIRFYYDGIVGNFESETTSEAETEVMADYDCDWSIGATCLRMDAPELINDDGVWVYQRSEIVRDS